MTPDVENHVDGRQCRNIMVKSGVAMDRLGAIWAMVDTGNLGKLTFTQMGFVLALLSQVQQGHDLDIETAARMAAPTLDGYDSRGHPTAAAAAAAATSLAMSPSPAASPAPAPDPAASPPAPTITPYRGGGLSGGGGAATTSPKAEPYHEDANDVVAAAQAALTASNATESWALSPKRDALRRASSSADTELAPTRKAPSRRASQETAGSPPPAPAPLGLYDDAPAQASMTGGGPSFDASDDDDVEVEDGPDITAAVAALAAGVTTPRARSIYVDTTSNSIAPAPLEEREWWAGDTNKVTVDKLVAAGSTGDFLVRESSKGKNNLVLVVHDSGQVCSTLA